MLYVTTREKYDAFTAARAIHLNEGPDGGRFLPYKMPRFGSGEFEALRDKSFGQNVADMLNCFFSTRFTGWDIEFCIGRYPIRVASMGQKVLVAECWRNLDGSYEKMERQIAARICGCGTREVKITSWVRIGIRICILFGIFGELLRQGHLNPQQKIDIAVPDDDFSVAMAVFYGRQMGLPVANMICGCSDGSEAWNLIHNGQVRPNGIETMPELERLLYGTLGIDETLKYQDTLSRGVVYALNADTLHILRKGIFAAVVSQERMESVIPNVYRTSSYIMEPGAAVSYAALMDYRAKTGESRCALLLADRNPVDAAKEVAGAMQMTETQLKDLLSR